MEIDGIRNRHCKSERVTVIQTVILQCVSGVSGSRNICDRIDSQLELWNKVFYGELVQDFHRATGEAL